MRRCGGSLGENDEKRRQRAQRKLFVDLGGERSLGFCRSGQRRGKDACQLSHWQQKRRKKKGRQRGSGREVYREGKKVISVHRLTMQRGRVEGGKEGKGDPRREEEADGKRRDPTAFPYILRTIEKEEKGEKLKISS